MYKVHSIHFSLIIPLFILNTSFVTKCICPFHKHIKTLYFTEMTLLKFICFFVYYFIFLFIFYVVFVHIKMFDFCAILL